jgi:hypothetical protein
MEETHFLMQNWMKKKTILAVPPLILFMKEHKVSGMHNDDIKTIWIFILGLMCLVHAAITQIFEQND